MSNFNRPEERDERRGIVVGVDGSPGSEHALRWALANADRFGPVQPIATWRYPWWLTTSSLPGGPLPPTRREFQEQAEAVVERALDVVGRRSCRAPIVSESQAGPTLVAHGAEADLIVVGTRGRGAVTDALLGSVSTHVAAHATVPVAIVPESATIDGGLRRVVVGLDGSPNSIAALSWAIGVTPDEATLEAVHAWSYTASTLPEAMPVLADVFELEARQTLDQAVVDATLATGRTGHEIVHRLEYGDPRAVLRDLSKDADLLVLGTRGHHGLAGLLVGSTTTGLAHQPPTTLVVVPPDTTHERSS